MVCPSNSGEEGVVVSRGGVVAKNGQAVTVVCPGTSGEVGDDDLGGQSVLEDVSKGAGGDATGGPSCATGYHVYVIQQYWN